MTDASLFTLAQTANRLLRQEVSRYPGKPVWEVLHLLVNADLGPHNEAIRAHRDVELHRVEIEKLQEAGQQLRHYRDAIDSFSQAVFAEAPLPESTAAWLEQGPELLASILTWLSAEGRSEEHTKLRAQLAGIVKETLADAAALPPAYERVLHPKISYFPAHSTGQPALAEAGR